MSDLKDVVERSRDIIENSYLAAKSLEEGRPKPENKIIHILPKEDLGEHEPFESIVARFIAGYYQVIKQSQNADTHAQPFRLAQERLSDYVIP